MKVKAVIFDIGKTLFYSPLPLNWSALYRPTFESIAQELGLTVSASEYEHIGRTLSKYNTRINPREVEVSSDTIFTEIIEGTNIPHKYLEQIKSGFYSFFRNDIRIYEDAEETLREIRSQNILIGTLSDVAYGMDNVYALADIEPLLGYIDIPFTSNDSGFRKPSGRGLEMLSEKMGVPTSEMIFVGDEPKDIECAKNAGAVGVLINRDGEEKNFGQEHEIGALNELPKLIAALSGE